MPKIKLKKGKSTLPCGFLIKIILNVFYLWHVKCIWMFIIMYSIISNKKMTFTENTCKLLNYWTLYTFYIQLNKIKLLILINRANNRTHCELITKYFNYIIAIFRLDVYKWKKYTKYKKAIPIELTKKLHVPNNAPCVFLLEGVGMAALYMF